ncbi:hypothetical protein [Arhodomonas sp. AD133]|uniref:hypothetical protein n=1 Tax=Arhodomonas sp. AD133 TaxID=3415009 RepID=UPI003EBE9165
MQGGTDSIESKWNKYVNQLVQHIDYICLQEAGALPQTSTPAPGPVPGWATAAPPAAFAWQYHIWNIGTQSRPKNVHILWGQTDTAGNRVNLAICSLIAPGALLYAPPGLAGGRPAMGMQFAPLVNIYTLHAFSGGGGDAGGLITNIGAGPAPWFALGDYNRAPTWAPPLGVLCGPDAPTHQGGGELDYMIKSGGGIQTGEVQQGGSWSDHFYVAYA